MADSINKDSVGDTPPPPPPPIFDDTNFLDGTAHAFEAHAQDLMKNLEDAQKAMEGNPSNPSLLAAFQAKLQAYTIFRNAQTSVVKVYKDVDSSIIQNFR